MTGKIKYNHHANKNFKVKLNFNPIISNKLLRSLPAIAFFRLSKYRQNSIKY